jgi:hypothetical protein
MDEDREKETNVDVVGTPEASEERERRVEEQTTETRTARNTAQEELAPLFATDEAERFRTRWLAIQSKFVDDPRESVKQADDLVSDVIQNVTKGFANRRGTLEQQWTGGEQTQTSTEDLRLALKQYRSFFERLLTLQS